MSLDYDPDIVDILRYLHQSDEEEDVDDDKNLYQGENAPISPFQEDISLDDKYKVNRKRKCTNPYANDIDQATETALQALDVDPRTVQGKKLKRQIRNRLSAKFHRERKNKHIEDLEAKISEQANYISQLHGTIEMLRLENTELRQHLLLPMVQTSSSSLLSTSQVLTDVDSDELSATTLSSSESPVIVSTDQSIVTSESSLPLPTFVMPEDNNMGHKDPNILLSRRSMGMSANNGLMKPIAFLCFICLICCTIRLPNNEVVLNNSFAINEATPGVIPPNRRLLSGTSDVVSESTIASHHSRSRQVLNESVSQKGISAPKVQRYLRERPLDNNRSSDSFDAITENAIFVPFQLPESATDNNWLSYHQGINGLSQSQIFLQKGVALFDPNSFKILNLPLPVLVPSFSAANEARGHDDDSLSGTIKSVTRKKTLEPQFGLIPALPSVKEDASVDDNLPIIAATNVKPIQMKNWPLIASPLPDQAAASASVNIEAALLSKFLSASNTVTVTVPVSEIRLGDSMQNSEGGTIESIMQMFNMTNNATHGHDYATALVEMNCVIIGAKIMLGATAQK